MDHVRVSWEEQLRFADLCGDHNPLHVDPESARRLPFGRVAVHGVHLVLAALERLAADRHVTPRHVRAVFRRSVTIGESVEVAVDDDRVTLTSGVWRIAELTVENGPAVRHRAASPSATSATPEIHTLDELAARVGESGPFAVGGSPADLAERFPALAARIGPGAVAELAALSRLVGMQLPGLHSLFSELDVRVLDDPEPSGHSRGDAGPTWTLTEVDERFRRVRVRVAGDSLEADVRAFVRPEPVEPDIAGVAVRSDAFAGQRWLVVGGSRGLGAVATLLLHAGGAEVCATHLGSPASGRQLVAPLERARTVRFDVDDWSAGIDGVVGDGWWPTHVAWFASPPIFDGAGDAWSDALFQRFSEVYVDRFVDVVERLGPHRLSGVLWPSTTAVEEPVRGLAEYAEAKRSGEAACQMLAERHGHLVVGVPRFGRLATDQTASVLPVDNAPPAPAVSAALERFARPSGGDQA